MSETFLPVSKMPVLDGFFRVIRLFSAMFRAFACGRTRLAFLSGDGFFSGRPIREGVVMQEEMMGFGVCRVRRGALAVIGCLFLAGISWAGDYSDGMRFYQGMDYENAFSGGRRRRAMRRPSRLWGPCIITGKAPGKTRRWRPTGI